MLPAQTNIPEVLSICIDGLHLFPRDSIKIPAFPNRGNPRNTHGGSILIEHKIADPKIAHP